MRNNMRLLMDPSLLLLQFLRGGKAFTVAVRPQYILMAHQQQMFRVRDTAQRSRKIGEGGINSPVEAKPGSFPQIPNETEPQEERNVYAGRREGAKPFLEQLFDDVRDADYKENAIGVSTAVDGRVPGGSYTEQVRRQWAKPNILQACVSTDAVPLPTTTGPVNYTYFDLSRHDRPEDPPLYGGLVRHRGRVFAGMHAAVDMRRTRDHIVLLPDGSLESKRTNSAAGGGASGSFYNESQELVDVHLRFLLSTIEQVKRRSDPTSAF